MPLKKGHPKRKAQERRAEKRDLFNKICILENKRDGLRTYIATLQEKVDGYQEHIDIHKNQVNQIKKQEQREFNKLPEIPLTKSEPTSSFKQRMMARHNIKL